MMVVGTWSRVLRARVSGAINILFGASTLPGLMGPNNVGMSFPSNGGLNGIPSSQSWMFGRRFGWAYAIRRSINNEIALFTMLNGPAEVQCKVSSTALNALKPKKPLESNAASLERSRPDVAKLAECNFFSFDDDIRQYRDVRDLGRACSHGRPRSPRSTLTLFPSVIGREF
jgi:hypothetical protein